MGLPAGDVSGHIIAKKPFNGLGGVFAHYGDVAYQLMGM
jgi:hypothetical protein